MIGADGLIAQVVPTTRHMAVLLSARVLPFAVYGAVRPANTWLRRGLWLGTYLLIPSLAFRLGAGRSILLLAGGFCYYLLVSLGVNHLRELVFEKRLGRAGLLMVLYVVYLLIPGIALPSVSLSTFLVFGCELALSSFSYCIETSRPWSVRRSLGEGLFFLFVNPTVLYTVRGAPRGGTVGFAGWWRVGAGVTLMTANVAFLRPMLHQIRAHSPWIGVPFGTVAGSALCGFLSLCTIYAAHSGLASIQIGLMQQIGWLVPERYCYPLLSRSPIEFWRRWNTYVRVWLEAYVFLPLARYLSRVSKARALQIAAAAFTLAVSGVIHGAVTFAARQELKDVAVELRFFGAAGALVVVWRVCALLVDRISAQMRPAWSSRVEVMTRVSGRCAVVAALVAAAGHWT